jgi:di/tricarboxylate transporter
MTALPLAAASQPLVDPAVSSLVALLVVMAVSLTSRINVGLLAIVLAWVVAVGIAGMKTTAVMAAFPSSLFVTLLGVSLLFGAAERNGTLAAITARIIGACRGVTALMPVVFFLLASGVSALGPGAIASTALIAPIAMSTGVAAGVPAVLMALMVGNGANAGNLSPFSAVGLIVQAQFAKVGLEPSLASVFFANFIAHTLAAAVAYLLFGGLKLVRKTDIVTVSAPAIVTRTHLFTLLVLVGWVGSVVFLDVNIGLSAVAAAALLILVGAAEDSATVKSVPWAVLVLVCGVSVMINILEQTGGIDLFTSLLSKIATPGTVNGMMAFVTGIISTYSSTSGVVYPTFLPAVPGLVEKLGGGNPLEIALSINVGAALVDVSPLSTLGALCIAALPAGGGDPKALFRVMLLWGFSMAVAGAVFCHLFIGWFA